jgi:undecaprenyl-diphosphatase
MPSLTHLVPSLASLGVWGYWIILLVSFAEALVLVGSFIPAAVFVLFAGVLVSKGVYDLGDMIIFASIGAILGDFVSYYLGSKGTHLFKNENKYFKEDHLARGKAFFKKYGDKSVLIGRFLGPLRSIIPFIAGLTGMNKRAFLFWNVIGGVAWAVSHLLIGYFFGGSLAIIHQWSVLVTVFVLGLTAALAILWVVVKHSTLLLRFWQSLFILLSVLVLYQIADVVFLGESIPFIDRYVHGWFLLVRDEELILFFKFVTILGNWQVIVPTASILSIWFLVKKRMHNQVVQLCVALVSAEAITYTLKLFVARPRPLDGLLVEHDFSFPSGHATIAMAFFGTLIYFISTRMPNSRKKQILLFFGASLIVLIGLSRLYLGVHYLSDVFAGYLVGLIGVILGRSVCLKYRVFLKGKYHRLRTIGRSSSATR